MIADDPMTENEHFDTLPLESANATSSSGSNQNVCPFGPQYLIKSVRTQQQNSTKTECVYHRFYFSNYELSESKLAETFSGLTSETANHTLKCFRHERSGLDYETKSANATTISNNVLEGCKFRVLWNKHDSRQ